MNNREWLNGLSNVEFANRLELNCHCCIYFKDGDCEVLDEDDMLCIQGNIGWLEQEHKEFTNENNQ